MDGCRNILESSRYDGKLEKKINGLLETRRHELKSCKAKSSEEDMGEVTASIKRKWKAAGRWWGDPLHVSLETGVLLLLLSPTW
jgi:hypothetical protein